MTTYSTHYLITIISVISIILLSSCDNSTPEETPENWEYEEWQSALIPLPANQQLDSGFFVFTKDLSVVSDSNVNPELISDLVNQINEITSLGISNAPGEENSRTIQLTLTNSSEASDPEAYEISIATKEIKISASDEAGIFRGIQTLLQMIPVEVKSIYNIPTGKIQDFPRFSYRGIMLDVARHFFSPEEVKQFIDHIARYKFNHLHLHLSDDQGWRIEIKSWPNLTSIGGSLEVGGGKGGFYTQEEYKDIVNYAQKKYITIVPEIDMPGHTNAALASYPELNCDGKATELYTGTRVGFSSLCTSKEITYQFLDSLFRELSELTPGPYLHMGGDESHVTAKKDYIPFVERVEKIVNKYGKQMIGWEEIVQASIDSTSVVQFWTNPEYAKLANNKSNKIIFSPAPRTYLDMKYDSTTTLGLHWAGYIEVDDAYLWDPDTFVAGVDSKQILGIETPLWSETVTEISEIEQLIFPRLTAIAEIGWTPAIHRTWEGYSERLRQHGKQLEFRNINFYKSPKINWDTHPARQDTVTSVIGNGK